MRNLINTGFVLLFSLRGLAAEPLALVDSANAAYAQGDFEKAAANYEEVLKMNYESPALYFNLGNTYYKLDKPGLSVLNYERAKKLSPYDDEINFNLRLANQRTLDKTESGNQLFLNDWWDNLKSLRSEKTWGLRSIVCFSLFLFFLGVFITSAKLLTRQIGFWLGLVFFISSLVSFFVAQGRYNDLVSKNSAVILTSSVEVKNSPSGSGTKLFILHEGSKVSAPETMNTPEGEWVKVELTPEKVGWVKRTSLEFI